MVDYTVRWMTQVNISRKVVKTNDTWRNPRLTCLFSYYRVYLTWKENLVEGFGAKNIYDGKTWRVCLSQLENDVRVQVTTPEPSPAFITQHCWTFSRQQQEIETYSYERLQTFYLLVCFTFGHFMSFVFSSSVKMFIYTYYLLPCQYWQAKGGPWIQISRSKNNMALYNISDYTHYTKDHLIVNCLPYHDSNDDILLCLFVL